MKPLATLMLVSGLLASGIGAPALAYDSAYTDFDLEACAMNDAYELGADWLCEGYGGIAYLVSEGDLRVTVSYGKDARDEVAMSQGFGPFNNPGARIEWLMGDNRSIEGTILRWFIARPDYTEADDQVLVVTKVEPGNTCHVAYVDARANANANVLAREAAEALIPGFDCNRDRVETWGTWSIPHTISAALS